MTNYLFSILLYLIMSNFIISKYAYIGNTIGHPGSPLAVCLGSSQIEPPQKSRNNYCNLNHEGFGGGVRWKSSTVSNT